MGYRRRRLTLWLLLLGWLMSAGAETARAIGWDSDDFLVIGAPNFSQYIGVFDHDFTFKGYLDTNFLGVAGLDFDAQGRLVADSNLTGEVRVYDPSGVKVGGFTQANSPMLSPAGDVKVAPDGNYVFGTLNNGVRLFTPQGTFIRQYGTGNHTGVTLVPGGRMWAGGAGITVSVFDYTSGSMVATFDADQQVNSGLLRYYASTNSVLMVDFDRDAGGAFERDLAGNLLRAFHVPQVSTYCNGAIRMPSGDIYGTHDWYAPSYPDLVHWSADGTVLGEKAIWPVEIKTGDILWAGSVPEPALTGVSLFLLWTHLGRRQARRGEENS
jgi:hypothetical protein